MPLPAQTLEPCPYLACRATRLFSAHSHVTVLDVAARLRRDALCLSRVMRRGLLLCTLRLLESAIVASLW